LLPADEVRTQFPGVIVSEGVEAAVAVKAPVEAVPETARVLDDRVPKFAELLIMAPEEVREPT
jgi:hypothetical protein